MLQKLPQDSIICFLIINQVACSLLIGAKPELVDSDNVDDSEDLCSGDEVGDTTGEDYTEDTSKEIPSEEPSEEPSIDNSEEDLHNDDPEDTITIFDNNDANDAKSEDNNANEIEFLDIHDAIFDMDLECENECSEDERQCGRLKVLRSVLQDRKDVGYGERRKNAISVSFAYLGSVGAEMVLPARWVTVVALVNV